MQRPEPFSTHRPWDAETLQAYRDQPTRNGWHYQLDEDCSPPERQQWRDWCRKYPRHWPQFVHGFIARSKMRANSGDERER